MKPSEFLTNIVDFFAVLLPGAIITFVIYQTISPESIFSSKIVLTETQSWIAFVLAAYILGSFIFFVGSLLDGKFYNWMRKKPYNWIRYKILDKEKDNFTYEYAEEYKKEMLKRNNKSVSNIKWAKANVYLFHPSAAPELHRFEANSKFFRSLSVVFFLLIFIGMIKNLWLLALICLLGFIFSLFCYTDQRYKYTELACIYLIAIYQKTNKG
ncbi:MAG TPA: hypothetical protein VK892_22060 [Pyrinomonadaceae bacterium]|nr:hypothetical protein [Pyrinomonadaceae bacterium]